MIKCIFTVDYEIYGNGEGSLRELMFEPAERLASAFRKSKARFVLFVEAAELEKIKEYRVDGAIDDVLRQVRELFRQGFEIGLHLHPQWFNARYEDGTWCLDYGEYNLCTLPKERIVNIIDRSLEYMREVLGEPDFTPLSYRAGNWLFQPSKAMAEVLASRGFKLDSSLFKGGLQHNQILDYRKALRNGYYWKFSERVEVPDPAGILLELPIYTQMVPFWKMLTTKRIGAQRMSSVSNKKSRSYSDFLRFSYPKKFDFCRMTLNELRQMVENVIRDDQEDPKTFRPIVAIGHTKDLVDLGAVESFLFYLRQRNIEVATFNEIYSEC